MNILAIESSCDETAAAIISDGRKILSSLVASQTEIHALYGGVVPEVASRRHLEVIDPLTCAAIEEAESNGLQGPVDAVAVTCAPGLIGALLVGVNYAKAYALGMGIPLIPVHHIRGHIASAYLAFPELEPPFLALVISGGHTLIIDVKDYTQMKIMASTRDDAAGEAFDKVARILGLGYPGGRALSEIAKDGDCALYPMPNCMAGELDMSFSGLKTAVINLVHRAKQKNESIDRASMASSFERAVCDMLLPRSKAAMEISGHKRLVIVGGVAANERLRECMYQAFGKLVFIPPVNLCGDNAAMIGSQAYYEYLSGNIGGDGLNAVATYPVDGSWDKLCLQSFISKLNRQIL